jgi:hypothetical protein
MRHFIYEQKLPADILVHGIDAALWASGPSGASAQSDIRDYDASANPRC